MHENDIPLTGKLSFLGHIPFLIRPITRESANIMLGQVVFSNATSDEVSYYRLWTVLSV